MKGTSFYEEQMGMAFDSIPCGLCIYQIVNGQILPRFRNPAFYEILGYSDTHRSDAGQGLDLGRVHPEDAGPLKEKLSMLVRDKGKSSTPSGCSMTGKMNTAGSAWKVPQGSWNMGKPCFMVHSVM